MRRWAFSRSGTQELRAASQGRPILAGLFGLLLLLPSVASLSQAQRITDSVDFSSETSRTAHSVRFGQGAYENSKASVGTLILPVSGIRLIPRGRLIAVLKTGRLSDHYGLQITLATAPSQYGKRQIYHVKLDGQKVYVASETDPGGGINHSFFIDFTPTKSTVEVELDADKATQAPVTVSSMRCYTGLVDKNKTPTVKSKMGLALVSPLGSGYSATEASLRETYRNLPQSPYLTRQLAVLYNFCIRTAPENRKEIDALSHLAEATSIPLRIAFQFHWAGLPAGVSDGAGGTFTDLPYQQITFDSDDHVDDPGLAALMGDRYDVRYGLSVPNRWSNTPWLTFNHPRLNQLRRIRLTQALSAWKAARERLVAAGKGNLLPPELSTGEETVYWAKGVDDSKYTELNGGKPRANLMGDFNPFVVTDALKEGVNLDPRDGLNVQERSWLHLNLARQQQRIIDWMFEALPSDSVQIITHTPRYSSDLVRRNLYTEPYAMPLFPMKEVGTTHPGLEVGYVNNGRSGGEYWSGAAMLPWLQKERERGRIALPNLECTGADDGQLVACLRAAYGAGARFATLYNWQKRTNIPQLLKAFADSIEKPAGQEWIPNTNKMGSMMAKWVREYVAGSETFGINRVELFPTGTQPTGLLRINIRDTDANSPDAITLTAKPDITPNGTIVVTLPLLFHQQPGRHYALTVAVDGPEQPSFLLAADGSIAVGLTSDIYLERARSIAIEDWQDAADILQSLHDFHSHSLQSLFAREALEEADRLLAERLPQEAYYAAIKAEQLTLPVTYDLPAPGGRLAPYWITILCPAGPVQARITTYSAQEATITVRSEIAQKVTLRWGKLETVAQLSANVPVEISLEQRKK
jgi:hypothetical protein